MFILDTDTFIHLLRGNPAVILRRSQATEPVVVTAITRIESLQGRFSAVLKAAGGAQLLLAQQLLIQNELDLEEFKILPINAAASLEFERLLKIKGLRRIGRPDLLITAITLAYRATLVTRNDKDFRKVPGLQMVNWVD
jgi:tRNA(fMet)-specific endonuclease VapC